MTSWLSLRPRCWCDCLGITDCSSSECSFLCVLKSSQPKPSLLRLTPHLPISSSGFPESSLTGASYTSLNTPNFGPSDLSGKMFCPFIFHLNLRRQTVPLLPMVLHNPGLLQPQLSTQASSPTPSSCHDLNIRFSYTQERDYFGRS